MTPRFRRAADALYKGFFNDTLTKGTCVACAIGNIVNEAQGGVITNKGSGWFYCKPNNFWWGDLFSTNPDGQQIQNWTRKKDLSERLNRLTGYHPWELAQVERAFEMATRIPFFQYDTHTEQEIMDDQFNGLCAAFDALMKLDNITEEPYQERLKQHPKLCLQP